MKKNSFPNVFIVILIVAIIGLLFYSLTHLNVFNEIEKNNDQNIIDLNIDLINLKDVQLPESDFVGYQVISSENIDQLNSKYYFIFDQEMISEFNFKIAEIGDVILEFNDYIIIYDMLTEDVKSLWFIGVTS